MPSSIRTRNLLHRLTIAAFIVFVTTVAVQTLRAQTVIALYSFAGSPDGQNPNGHLILDANGNLYGTTFLGGAGMGTVYKLDPAGNETVLHIFAGSNDGANPWDGVVFDMEGNIYGAASAGGAYTYGAVFKIDTTGTETIIHSMVRAQGITPKGGLIIDAQGNLYGTCFDDGLEGYGSVFALNKNGAIKGTIPFDNSNGAHPVSSLAFDPSGTFAYGTTDQLGSLPLGTVFKVDKQGHFTDLAHFSGSNGALPEFASLVFDRKGNAYGTTTAGGTVNGSCPSGCGTVYTVERVIHSFAGAPNDGAIPGYGVTPDGLGNLYGTTSGGGNGNCNGGCGTIFKIDSNGNETVVYNFTGTDILVPTSGLVMDAAGNFYGTASGGTNGFGVIYEFVP